MEKPAKEHLPKAPLIRENFTYSGNIWEEVWWYISIPQPVFTRWNSMFLHVSKIAALPWSDLSEVLSSYSHLKPTARERGLLLDFVKILKPFHTVTQITQGEKVSQKGKTGWSLLAVCACILISDLVRVFSMAYEFMSGKYHTSGGTNVHPKAHSSGISQTSFKNRGLPTMSGCLTSCEI